MQVEIICAVIAGLFSIVVCIVSNNSTKNLIEYRIKQLENKIDDYSDVIQRLIIVEQSVRSIQHQINDMKGELK